MAFHEQKWVSKATIYRTLGLMVEANLLEEQDFGEGFKTYESIHIKSQQSLKRISKTLMQAVGGAIESRKISQIHVSRSQMHSCTIYLSNP